MTIERKQTRAGRTAVARKTDGNPEGKGLNGLLLDWDRSAPRDIVAKPHRQVVAELFTSMLVLSAAFKYRPVIGVNNYLYWIKGQWLLSLIGPDQWSHERRGGFAGTCVLQRDMTWTIAPSDLLAEANPASDALSRFFDAFAETMNTDLTLEEVLPLYVGGLPYYQRLYATALTRSLRAAITLGEQSATSCREWYRLLPRQENELLALKV